ncbi:MAG TPA: APC family permease, partial [Actinomycetes bacterium]
GRERPQPGDRPAERPDQRPRRALSGGRVTLLAELSKRLLVGRPLRSAQLHDQLLPKWMALPVFCSDPLSSVAYATEQILLVLAAGGAAYLAYAKWVALGVVLLLAIVVLSYRQTCYAYPNGGGAFAVSYANLGESAALIAASALLVDYVMTVVVSVVAGVIAVTSASPGLHHHAVVLSVGMTALIALANLRGVKESGRAFAIPTYAFIASVGLLFLTAMWRATHGGIPEASTAGQHLEQTAHVGGIFTLLLVLRAFASGCTALTGVEAISNGVPAFRKPKSANAAATLMIMGAIAIIMFSGITALALHLNARAQPDGEPSVISQLAASVFGEHAPMFYVFQAATAAVLILAANTAYNGFPLLASLVAQQGFLPRQLHNRGDRLVFSNGILMLSAAAIALIIAFDANLDRLIQLYIVGVFTSFTLSQAGMVRHWARELAQTEDQDERRRIRRAQAVNATGAAATALVLLIVVYSKFTHGAWIAILAMIAMFALMKSIHRHYARVAAELEAGPTQGLVMPARNRALVLVSKIHQPTLRALAYAKSTRPSTLEALTVQVDEEETKRLEEEWAKHEIDIPLVVLQSPYREVTDPVVDYIRRLRSSNPRDVITVFIPEYVVGRWWEQLLHNQSPLRLKLRLLFEPGVMVTSVPYQLDSSVKHPENIGRSSSD